MATSTFVDPSSQRECKLTVPPGGQFHPRFGRPKIGVIHPDCEAVADVSLELDAFFCAVCGWNGRISGVWAVQMATDILNGHSDTPDV